VDATRGQPEKRQDPDLPARGPRCGLLGRGAGRGQRLQLAREPCQETTQDGLQAIGAALALDGDNRGWRCTLAECLTFGVCSGMLGSPRFSSEDDMGASVSKNARLLKYFVQQYPGIPRKRLVKLVYMADIISRQFLGRPISTFAYRLDKFGPYDPAIEDAVAELVAAGLAREDVTWEDNINWKRLRDSGRPIAFDFTPGESEILAYTAKNYLNMPMPELLDDVVYETSPMKEAEVFRAPLRMELVDNEGRKAVGFDLEAVIRAERQAEAGNHATLGAFLDGLRTRIASRHSK